MEKIYLGEVDDISSQFLEGSLPKFWINLEGQDYLFKNNFSFNIAKPIEFPTDVGEVLYSRMRDVLGVPCVQSKFAGYESCGELVDGVLIKSYFQNDYEFSINYAEMLIDLKMGYSPAIAGNVEKAVDVVKKYAELHNYNINIRKTHSQLKQQAILDYFFSQEDRSLSNVGFIASCDKLRIAPIFDNGFSLSFANQEDVNKNILKRLRKGQDFSDLWTYTRFGLKQFFGLPKDLDALFASQIAEEANHSRKTDKLIDKILDIDLQNELSLLEICRGVPLKPIYKKIALALFEHKKQLYLDNQNHKQIDLEKNF